MDYADLARQARLSEESYAVPPPPGIVIEVGSIRAVLTENPGGWIDLTYRGTRPPHPRDWAIDFSAWLAKSAAHPQLGRCHAGIMDAVLPTIPLILPHVRGRRVRPNGHSLGGGAAIIGGAVLLLEGVELHPNPTSQEAPRVAEGPCRKLFADAGIAWWQVRYGDDPVTEVPPWLGHMAELIPIGAPMTDPFDCHAIGGIAAWLSARQALTK
nr:hypothetical protein [uncultured Rhodopila sp.]